MGNIAQIKFATNLYLYLHYGSPWLLQNIHKTLSNKETWENPERLIQVLAEEIQSGPAAEWVKKVDKCFEQFEKQGLKITDRAPVFAVLEEPAEDVEYEVDFHLEGKVIGIKCRDRKVLMGFEDFVAEEFFSKEITEENLHDFLKSLGVEEKGGD
jgi:hypothetical protein